MGYKNRPRHRCPKCRSTNIYKRTCNYNWFKNSKKRGRHKDIENDSDNIIKKYLCSRCKNEFDIAIVE